MPPQPRPFRCRLHPLRSTSAPILALILLLAGAGLRAQSLDGSRTSLVQQNLGAAEEGFTYLRTPSEVNEFVRLGLLVKVPGNADYLLAGVSFPYARDEVKRFVERLAHQYRSGCGEPLVVTSLTRPVTRQPYNASELSVHPTGMAVDLRRSNRSSCRRWLESTLLWLEGQGVVEATREHYPAHYHVSVFGTRYGRYLAALGDGPDVPADVTARTAGLAGSAAKSTVARARSGKSGKGRTVRAKSSSRGKSARYSRARSMSGRSRARVVHARTRSSAKRYRVGHGDNLWQIAKRHGTSVASLKRANGIRSNHLRPGQVLAIPSKAR